MITVMIKLRWWWWWGAGEGGGGWRWRWWWWWCEFYIKWLCIMTNDGNDDDVCLIAPTPLLHRHSPDSFYMNTNLNAFSKIHQGNDGINLTKDLSYKMPDILTKQIATSKASSMHIQSINDTSIHVIMRFVSMIILGILIFKDKKNYIW